MTDREAAKVLDDLAAHFEVVTRVHRREKRACRQTESRAAACRLGAAALRQPRLPREWPLPWERHDHAGARWWTAPLPAGADRVVVGMEFGWKWWYESQEATWTPCRLRTYTRPQDARRAAARAVARAVKESMEGGAK